MRTVAKALSKEFRHGVVAVVRRGQAPLKVIAADFGIAKSCLRNWLRADQSTVAVTCPILKLSRSPTTAGSRADRGSRVR